MKNRVKNHIICNLSIFAISILFSLLAMTLDMLGLSGVLSIILGAVLIVPIFFSLFVLGSSRGEKLYKDYANVDFGDLHKQTSDRIPYYMSLYDYIGFVVWAVLFNIIAVLSKSTVMQYFVTILGYPLVMILKVFGIMSNNRVTPVLLVLIAFTALEIGTFMLGYLNKIRILKLQQRDIEFELRSYNN